MGFGHRATGHVGVDPRTFAERELQVFERADDVVGAAEDAAAAVVTPKHDAYTVHAQHLRRREAQLGTRALSAQMITPDSFADLGQTRRIHSDARPYTCAPASVIHLKDRRRPVAVRRALSRAASGHRTCVAQPSRSNKRISIAELST